VVEADSFSSLEEESTSTGDDSGDAADYLQMKESAQALCQLCNDRAATLTMDSFIRQTLRFRLWFMT
jgi:hypothetical protein